MHPAGLRSLLGRLPLPAFVLALFAVAAPAPALVIGFDDLPSLSDAAAASLAGGVSTSAALVVSESDAGLLTGLPAAGTWATTGANGLLNTLGSAIVFTFAAPVSSLTVDVLSIARDGVTYAIELVGYAGATPVASAVSDPSLLGDSGLHEQELALTGAFTSVAIRAVAPCAGGLCAVNETSTFFLDTLQVVPEPGTAILLALGLGGIARFGRREGAR